MDGLNRQNFVIQSDQTHQAFLSGQAENISNIYAHDMFEPSWNCEVKSRVPTLSGEWVSECLCEREWVSEWLVCVYVIVWLFTLCCVV
jgi:hypothetical protein